MCRKSARKKERQLTQFEDPDQIVEGSSYGPVAFRDWCRLESKRFKQSGLHPVVHANGGGRIALFVN